MVSTIFRFFFCFSLVLITASKRKLDEKDEPAFKLARTVTRTGPAPAVADEPIHAYPLITSDIAATLLEISDFSLAYPFSLVSREFFTIVCGACFRRLQRLPISPSIPTSKAILTFASQYLKMAGLKISPEIAIDTILRLITGTDNQQIFMQAVTFLSQLELPESKQEDVVYACTSLRSRLKPGENSHTVAIDYLKIKFGGFVGFYNVVIDEIFYQIRCTQDKKFCRAEHVNRSKKTFFGNIRVFYPEFFEKMHEELYIMDNFPIFQEVTFKFLPIYQEIVGGVIVATPVLTLDSIFEKIRADDYDLFWKMCLMQLAALPRWEEVTSLVCQDPDLNKHFSKISEVLRAFSAPAGFSVKSLSVSKRKYVFTCLFNHVNLGADATDEEVKLIATKAVNARDIETSSLLVAILKSAGYYKAIFDAIDAAAAIFNPHLCALNLIKNLSGLVLIDYMNDRRRNILSALLLHKLAGNLEQIVNGNVMLAERYNEILEYAAKRDLLSARQMAYMIVYTAHAVPFLRTDENLSIIVETLSKKGIWVQNAYKNIKSKGINFIDAN